MSDIEIETFIFTLQHPCSNRLLLALPARMSTPFALASPALKTVDQLEDETCWAVQHDNLGSTCAKSYIDNVYFEVPVLDIGALYTSWQNRKAPFLPESPLHHALILATVSWLGKSTLIRHGFTSREEAFDVHFNKLKVCMSPWKLKLRG